MAAPADCNCGLAWGLFVLPGEECPACQADELAAYECERLQALLDDALSERDDALREIDELNEKLDDARSALE